MKKFGGLVKFTKNNDMLLAALMIAYLLFEVPMPNMVCDVVNSNMGAGVLIILAIALFVTVDKPILTVLAFIVVYECMRRCKQAHRSKSFESIPSSNNPKRSFKSLSNFGYTLEEGMANMVEGNDHEDKDDTTNPSGFNIEGLSSGSTLASSKY